MMKLSDYRIAHEIAQFNPRFAIEGWLAGARAAGQEREALHMQAALDIQRRWRQQQIGSRS